MLFNTYEFILGFLPICWAIYALAIRTGKTTLARSWLVACSLYFYGSWKPEYLALILVSIAFNFSLGAWIQRQDNPRPLLTFGIVANLGLLGYFKYANFFVDNLNAVSGSSFRLEPIVLPLAISFFTFQQITYLVDTARGDRDPYSFLDYCLFVCFFPQLVAGPIVHHKEVMPQFAATHRASITSTHLAVGTVIFSIGLFKKVVLADNLALIANPVFDAVAAGGAITFAEAWAGALGYTFQLYFDFSGYSDMAIGIARCFGILLPLNFNSPYKSASIADFWRRWHMTLSRFLRESLYIPLGGNRRGRARRYANLFITMLLGGLWHGAGWTFVIWGALHGVYLILNHGFRAIKQAVPGRRTLPQPLRHTLSVGFTFAAVLVGWVFFRAADFESALIILGHLGGRDGLETTMPLFELQSQILFVWIAAAAILAFAAPSTQEFMRDFNPAFGYGAETSDAANPTRSTRFALRDVRFRFDAKNAVLTSAIILVCVLYMQTVQKSQFLYYDF